LGVQFLLPRSEQIAFTSVNYPTLD
jgi:hypothetical protein